MSELIPLTEEENLAALRHNAGKDLNHLLYEEHQKPNPKTAKILWLLEVSKTATRDGIKQIYQFINA